MSRNPQHQETSQWQHRGRVSGPGPAVAAILMRVCGVQVCNYREQAASLEPDMEEVPCLGGPFGVGIWGIFPGLLALNPAILWISWKFFNLLNDLPLYKFPSCITSQMCFIVRNQEPQWAESSFVGKGLGFELSMQCREVALDSVENPGVSCQQPWQAREHPSSEG